MPANGALAEPAAIKPAPLANNSKAKDKAARVRDSQRASRARKRELVESLRTRIAEFERRDVQASLEIQQAARAVAVENMQLRNLLALHGVGHAEINAFLQNGDAAQARQLAFAHYSPTKPQLDNRQKSDTDYQHGAGGQPVMDENGLCEQRQAAGLPSSDADCAARPPLHSVLETPCDNATAILVQVRGLESEVSIRAALGCTGPGSCVVRNTRLLQLMEEAG